MDELIPGFSGTTTTENIAMKITVMDIAKNYFNYEIITGCGYPYVEL